MDKLRRLVADNIEECFYIQSVPYDAVSKVSNMLSVILPKDYTFFLENYGMIIAYGVEILGCGLTGVPPVVIATQRYRTFGLRHNAIVIREIDEWVECLDLLSGEIFTWDRHAEVSTVIANSFEEYVCSCVEQARENW